MPRILHVHVRHVAGGKLTSSQKLATALGTTALLGLAGAAAYHQVSQPQATHLDNAMKALQTNNLPPPEPAPVPQLTRAQVYAQLNAKNRAISEMHAKAYGLPPARSYDEIIKTPQPHNIPGGDSRLTPGQLRKRPAKR